MAPDLRCRVFDQVSRVTCTDLIMLKSLVRFQLVPLLTSTFAALVTRSGALAPQCTTAGMPDADVGRVVVFGWQP